MTHSGKTKKALLKRIKVTGRRKLMKRPPGQNHFNAKDSGNDSRKKRGHKMAPRDLAKTARPLLSKYL